MSKQKKKSPSSREITVINIRAMSSNKGSSKGSVNSSGASSKSTSGGSGSSSSASSKSSVLDMADGPYSSLSKKPSSILTQMQQSGRAADEMRASSLPSESMYRYALRANHHSTAKDSAASIASSKSKLGEPPIQQVASANGSSKQVAGEQMVWLHVHYVQGNKRKRIMFPPGILVEQARDLCMLRFGVWQEIMKRGATPQPEFHSTENATEIEDEAISVSTRSTSSNDSSRGSNAMREQYGLYWPGHAQWLEPQTPLSRYMLSNGDRLELQNHAAFVSTPAISQSSIRHKASDSGVSRTEASEDERTVEGEGPIYYLQNKGISTAWRQCWLELHGTTLACYKRAGRLRMGLGMVRSTRDAPLLVVDLAGGFRLVDQHGRRDQK
ncbi:hypothetical protein H4R20_002659, partial [Coemansia guatemalensis]